MIAPCRVIFLAVLLVVVSRAGAVAQSVGIVSPATGDLIQHSGGFANVTVVVSATGVPTGGGVEIVLDMGTSAQKSVTILAPPYPAAFSHVPVGEHTLDAFVLSAAKVRLAAHDRHDRVGVGDILVAVGDSITAGEVDDIKSDDWSADGRNGPVNGYGGFEPILNNRLTGVTGYPNSVPNEGLPGETAAGAKTRVAEIIASVFKLIVPTCRNSNRSRVTQTACPARRRAAVFWIETKIPNAGEVNGLAEGV